MTDSSLMKKSMDTDIIGCDELTKYNKPKRFLKRSAPSSQHESLSYALLRALPNLLVKFKSDSIILESLANLPRYLIPTVFSLPQRRAYFVNLVKHLCEIYLQSNDESVL